VLTGSTNYSITGLYVNSNHVLIFNDATVAATYARIFKIAWDAKVWDGKQSTAFSAEPEAGKTFSFSIADLPPTDIAFSPHKEAFGLKLLEGVAKRITKEESVAKAVCSSL
jgi:phosphatidylserine/phosphatidylglycerophosphate/cardiolipin synthase-like enzyme